jgi:hypothetical protein
MVLLGRKFVFHVIDSEVILEAFHPVQPAAFEFRTRKIKQRNVGTLTQNDVRE